MLGTCVFLDLCAEEIAELCGSENEEEAESEEDHGSEESKHGTDEDCSEDE